MSSLVTNRNSSTAQKIVNWATTANGCVHTADTTQLNLTVESRRRRRSRAVCIGHNETHSRTIGARSWMSPRANIYWGEGSSPSGPTKSASTLFGDYPVPTAATVVQGPGRCRRSRRTAGTPSYCRGNGLAGRRHPRSRLPSQCSAAAATAIDRSWRRRTTVAALISIVVAAITFKF